MPLSPATQTHWKCWFVYGPACGALAWLLTVKGCLPGPTPPTPNPPAPTPALAISTVIGSGKPIAGPVTVQVGTPVKHSAVGAGVTQLVWHVDAPSGGNSAGYGVYPDLTGDQDLLAVPTAPGTYTVRVLGVKGKDLVMAQIPVTVVGESPPGPGPTPTPGKAPSITSASTASGTVSAAFNFQVTATGDAPITWSATGAPDGLQLAADTGQLTGTPTKAGTFPVEVTATNKAGSDKKTLTITVKDAPAPPPIPGTGLRVLFVYQNDAKGLPKGQVAALYSKAVKDYLRTHCADGPDGRTKEWRMYEQSTNVSGESKLWQDAMARQRSTLPWMVVSNGTSGYEGPLPADADSQAAINKTLDLLKKYGGP